MPKPKKSLTRRAAATAVRVKQRRPTKQTLIYGIYRDSVVFADEEQVKEIAAFWQVKTWGAFRARARDLYREAVRRMKDNGSPIPKDSQPFQVTDVPGVEDGEFPLWLLQQMMHVLPNDVAEEFGEPTYSFASGDAITISPESEAVVVRMLRARGFRCIKNQRLISSAEGSSLTSSSWPALPDHGVEAESESLAD